MRLGVTIVLVVGFALAGLSGAVRADDEIKQKSKMWFFADQIGVVVGDRVKGAKAELHRFPDRACVHLDTNQLPESAYTMWMRAFNNTDDCVHGEGPDATVDNPRGLNGSRCSRGTSFATCIPADSCAVFNLQGGIIGPDGRGHFSACTAKDNPSGYNIMEPFFSPQGTPNALNGLTNPMGAEIHIVLKDHGPREEGGEFGTTPSALPLEIPSWICVNDRDQACDRAQVEAGDQTGGSCSAGDVCRPYGPTTSENARLGSMLTTLNGNCEGMPGDTHATGGSFGTGCWDAQIALFPSPNGDDDDDDD